MNSIKLRISRLALGYFTQPSRYNNIINNNRIPIVKNIRLYSSTSQLRSELPRGSDEPSDRIKALVEEVLALTLLEKVQFENYFQKRLGITDEQLDVFYNGTGGGGGGGGGGGSGAAAAEPEQVKDVFDIKLTAIDAKSKIKIIKEVRAITGLGLKEAKEMVEKAPVVLKEGLKKEEVEELQKKLTEVGATVEIL